MSTMGFEVHVDKENVPAISKGGFLKNFGPRDVKGKVQATPRKALLDVNHESANIVASRNVAQNKLGSGSTDLKEECFSAIKPSLLKTSGAENAHVGAHNKKDTKKASVLKKEIKVLKYAELPHPKIKPTRKSKNPMPEPKTKPKVTDEDYDSDSIFPRSERLSTYIDKLLTWRFPCLIGPARDSESDTSDLEEGLPDDFVLDLPPFLPPMIPEFSDADLDTLIQDFPPPKPDCEDYEEIALQNTELCINQDR